MRASLSEGSPRVLLIDGPAGAGKTTLAALVPVLTECFVVHMDDLYDGWDGLDAGVGQVAAILGAVATGRPASYRRYDWVQDRYAEEVAVPTTPLLVIEGVGAGGTDHRADLLVWVEAPAAVRRERVTARGDFGDHWERWAEQESRHFAAAGTRDRADVVMTLPDER